MILVFLFLFPLVSSFSPEDRDPRWRCGGGKHTMLTSEVVVNIQCPELKQTLNECCWTHAKCYSAQKGQKLCDDTFCSCVADSTKPSQICTDELSPFFCSMAQTYGTYYYEAVPNTPKYLEEGITDPEEDFSEEMQ